MFFTNSLTYKNYFTPNWLNCQQFSPKKLKYFLLCFRKVDLTMFPTYEKIKELADNHGISLTKIEEDLGYSRNTLYKLKSQKPNAERISEIADYFQVSTDYLLGRTDNPSVASSSKGIGSPSDTPRKAKSLSVADQERLLQLMDLTFQDVLSGGGDNEHDL